MFLPFHANRSLPGSGRLQGRRHFPDAAADIGIVVGEEAPVRESQIAEEIPLEGEAGARVHRRVAGGEEHGRVFQALRRLGIERRVKAVDGAFELTADVVIVDGRGEHQHIRLREPGIDLLHVILLRTGARSPAVAVFAGKAAADVHAADAENLHGVSALLCRLAEGGDHFRSLTLRAGTAVQNKDIQGGSPLYFQYSVSVTPPFPRRAAMSAAL